MAKQRGKHWKKGPDRGSIKYQISQNLRAQYERGRGTSKRADKDSGRGFTGKIYSGRTLRGYTELNCQAVDWMKEQGQKPRDIPAFIEQMPAYLEHLKTDGYSAWTIHAHASAAVKLYGGKTADLGVELPHRRSAERSYNQNTEQARKSLQTRERDLLEVLTLTGLRRSEAEAFRRGDHRDFIDGRTDTLQLDGHRDNTKGARSRDVPLPHDDAERVRELLRTSPRMQRERPLSSIDRHLSVHICRHGFAKRTYGRLLDEKHARGEETRAWYTCRDGSGLRFDRDVAQQVSEALGHSRVDTSIIAYLR